MPIRSGSFFLKFDAALQKDLSGAVVRIERQQLAELAGRLLPRLIAIGVERGIIALQQRRVGRLFIDRKNKKSISAGDDGAGAPGGIVLPRK